MDSKVPRNTNAIVIGLLLGILPWLPGLKGSSEEALIWLLVVPFLSPVVGVVLLIFDKTRSYGLGVLLSSGFGWLMLGAMCSGLY